MLISLFVDSKPFDATFTFVVVTSAGRDRLEAPAFFVNWIDRDRKPFGDADGEVFELLSDSEEALPVTDILSRATSVTAAALGPPGRDGQVLKQSVNFAQTHK